MISRLTGTFVEVLHQGITLDVRDVGYHVFVTDHWKGQGTIGNPYTLSITTVVKDDAIELYGFATPGERQLFELLLTVSGVGPRTALSIIGYGVTGVQQAVVTADVEFFSKIPRIGKKNAQKIIIELKSKLGGMTDLDLSEEQSGKQQELLDALVGMGFVKQDVINIIKNNLDSKDSIEINIRKALKLLGKK